MKFSHFKMPFTCIVYLPSILLGSRESQAIHFAIFKFSWRLMIMEGTYQFRGSLSLPLLLKLPVSFPDSATFKSNFLYEPIYFPRTLWQDWNILGNIINKYIFELVSEKYDLLKSLIWGFSIYVIQSIMIRHREEISIYCLSQSASLYTVV